MLFGFFVLLVFAVFVLLVCVACLCCVVCLRIENRVILLRLFLPRVFLLNLLSLLSVKFVLSRFVI